MSRLIARGAHLEAIKAHGLRLVIASRDAIAHMPAASDPAELGLQDYVIVALKSHQAWEVADQMKPLLGGRYRAKRDSVVVLSWIRGLQFANLQLQSVDPDGRQWSALGQRDGAPVAVDQISIPVCALGGAAASPLHASTGDLKPSGILYVKGPR